MTTVAVLPIKTLANAKTRLAEELTAGPRQALVEAMFSDVLTALRRTAAIERVVVVSADNAVQRIAGGHGAEVLEDQDSGHSDAAAIGVAWAKEQDFKRVLLVPGDTPLLDPGELMELLAMPVGERSALIVPDRHGPGTNALVLTPPDSLTPSFGEGSAQRHYDLASEQGTDAQIVSVDTLGMDVDTPEDLTALVQALAGRHGGAAHTRGMLNQLQRSRS